MTPHKTHTPTQEEKDAAAEFDAIKEIFRLQDEKYEQLYWGTSWASNDVKQLINGQGTTSETE